MENLISLNQTKINKELVNTVNARDLWKKLGSKRQFSDWIKDRLQRFVENEDYVIVSHNTQKILKNQLHKFMEPENQSQIESKEVFHKNMKNLKNQGGRPTIDYFLTIDTAKMICMLENNEIGDKIRRYFVECEKELFSRKNLRIETIRTRFNLTDKIQELYGDIIERKKENGIKDWTYSNYTKLIYKKVFGKSKASDIKKMYHLTEKENIRDSHKIPSEKIDQIIDWEYSLHCFLQTLKKQGCKIEDAHDNVKIFLFGDAIEN